MSLMRRAVRPSMLGVCLLIAMTGSHAWDGTISGKINEVSGVGGSGGAPGNYDLRIVLTDVTEACGPGTPNWSYVNANDANYKGLMALLLMARAAANSVTLYTTKDPRGFCQIGYVVVRPT